MKLSELLYKVSIISTIGEMGVEVKGLAFDSRKVEPGFVFIAMKGTEADGHLFIEAALEKGAIAIVAEQMPEEFKKGVTYTCVKDSREATSIMASHFYKNPSKNLQLIGVTGTNGKTTTATLMFELFKSLGHKCGLISTISNKIMDDEYPATHTTPDAISLNALLAKMVRQNITHCFMEVSSHALHQKRVYGLTYKVGVFTNISHDHLDYHQSFENYITAKKILFDSLPPESFAIVNIDDKRGRIMLQNTRADKSTFSLKAVADFKGKLISDSIHGLEMEIGGKEVWFKLVGSFNAYNLLGVYATAVKLGEDPDEVLRHLSMIGGVAGRFETVRAEAGVIGIVDYAHTPDALENVLSTIQKIRTGNENVITVLGCGGNRDKGKRPIMASIACKYSNKVIVTSDNPRYEDPAAIMSDMIKNLDPVEMRKVLKILDREEAIKTACMLSGSEDIILVAGKGHETYQEVKGERYPFDDKEVLNRMFKLNLSK
ncbi:MAG: UDP-N-acetylmuramoyl-L-alanyl-D-glutamate--2,6-diaminopimelate ligase [Cyclobacteriaceae bacterium]|nr:UDP-N-acetylmuramoyl-L-alanyl-D-glutamate--2,6-diaminopimelate ligase [Cyclobacteriaceae bacterium]